ncbi:protein boule-like [Xenia sp. Carnegie-2017]|uniref:protein boule-like n=1 Tax=Xenia sp. Carnegie-2017 TaxID=2897299 RepID=UPI001F033B0F|nr:protein boule-like [Xenia sp. Carnegie-2017]
MMMEPAFEGLQPEEEIFPNRVFLGGLDRKFTELQLEKFFSEIGPVNDVRIVCDRKTGLSKGYGFVTFENVDVCQELIKQGSIEYEGKTLRVRTAVRRKGQGQFEDEKKENFKLKFLNSQPKVNHADNMYYTYLWPPTAAEYQNYHYALAYQNVVYVPAVYYQPWTSF